MKKIFAFPDPLEVVALSSIQIYSKPKRARPDDVLTGGTGGAAGRIARMLRRAPEVMVKITGGGKNAGQVYNHLTYIGRNGNVVLENEDGDRIQGKAAIKDELGGWAIDSMKGAGRYRQTYNIMLSMPKGTPAEKVLDAARQFARERFGSDRPYMLALHTDKSHPHVHICVRTEGIEPGDRLRIQKTDLQAYREHFAEKMTERGVEATATPRPLRGKTRKAQKAGVYRAAKEGRSTVIRSAIQQVENEKRTGGGSASQEQIQPWKARIEKRRAQLIEQYDTAIRQALAKGKVSLAAEIQSFKKALPPIKTQRDIIRERIQARQQERQALREEQQKKPQQIHAPQQPPQPQPQPQEKEMER